MGIDHVCKEVDHEFKRMDPPLRAPDLHLNYMHAILIFASRSLSSLCHFSFEGVTKQHAHSLHFDEMTHLGKSPCTAQINTTQLCADHRPRCTMYARIPPQQATAIDHLTLLPKELLVQVLQYICFDSNKAVVNQSLLAMRCCSKALATASDSARPSITLHPSHLQDAASYLTKLTNLTAVTIFCPASSIPLLCKLSLVSAVIPHLTSLRLHTDGNHSAPMQVLDMTEALLPWRYTLKHLEISGCVMTETNLATPVETWSPDLPELASLVVKQGTFSSLFLKYCTGLNKLELIANRKLFYLGVSGIGSLLTAEISCNDLLLEVDLSHCNHLHFARFVLNHSLVCVNVCGCIELRVLGCSTNQVLAGLSVVGCTLLDELDVVDNHSLKWLDTTGCSMLHRMFCRNNISLQSLKVPHHGCLRKVTVSKCQSLEALDFSGWKHIICSNNSKLTSLNASNCSVLHIMLSKGNVALTELDVSGCRALRGLDCSRNPLLVNLNLSGCRSLMLLTRRGCPQLEDVDVSMCRGVRQVLTEEGPSLCMDV